MDRGEIFEDLFDDILKRNKLGEVIGGGTLQEATGEIESCDIEINIKQRALDKFISFIKKVDIISKGSWIEVDNKKIEIGIAEGLALYLNGIDLPKEVYKSCDVNYLIENLEQLLEGIGERLSHWEGSTESALYFYGVSYEEMRQKISSFVQ